MGYWKSKVLPKIKKVFEKNGATKKAVAEASNSFVDSKEEINKEFEEKKTELQPKVLEIYEASSTEIKALVKERTEDAVKKNPEAVTKFIEDLTKIEFPGSKPVGEAISKFGPAYFSAPVVFILEKVSTFLPAEEAAMAGEESGVKEKEVVVAKEEKKAEEVEKVEEKKVEEETSTPLPPPAEEVKAAAAEVPAQEQAEELAKAADGEEVGKA